MPLMAKKKPDTHRMPQFQLRLHKDLLDSLQALAERNRTSATEEARRAIREYLTKEGLWPRQTN